MESLADWFRGLWHEVAGHDRASRREVLVLCYVHGVAQGEPTRHPRLRALCALQQPIRPPRATPTRRESPHSDPLEPARNPRVPCHVPATHPLRVPEKPAPRPATHWISHRPIHDPVRGPVLSDARRARPRHGHSDPASSIPRRKRGPGSQAAVSTAGAGEQFCAAQKGSRQGQRQEALTEPSDVSNPGRSPARRAASSTGCPCAGRSPDSRRRS